MKLTVIALILLAASNCAYADLFKCKGQDGATKFQDKPCDVSDQLVERKEMPKGSSSSGAAGARMFKVNVDGSCPENYNLVGGACVHVLGMNRNAKEMAKEINQFKRSGKSPESNSSSSTDKSSCEKYKAIYDKYKREGVMGINPLTGEMRKMTGRAAADAIENAKQNVEIMCE